MLHKPWAAVAVTLAACGAVWAAPEAKVPVLGERAKYEIRPATSPIKVDGVLDEPAWQDALTLPLTYEVVPGDNTPPPVETTVYLTYDEEKLYFAFRAQDDPAAVRAHLSDRDKALSDDLVGLVLDTFRDERRAFEFEVNPLGVQNDYSRNEVTGGYAIEDPSWDAIWSSAGRITEDGYEVEAAVPFHQLRFPRSAGKQLWGFAAYRLYPRNVTHVVSVIPNDRNDPCLLCQAVDFEGLEGITPGRNLEITPTLTGHRTDQRTDFPEGPLASGDDEYEAGLSVRWGVTPNLNLNAAVNPDFSQVEADAAQLEVNQRFALFYPEKRPFFLEGADSFATPINAVHTRSVLDPSWGLKLTGKEDKNLIGVFVAEDDVTQLILPANQGSGFADLPVGSTTAAVRYRRDLGSSSTLGVLATAREGGGFSSYLYGADAQVDFSPSDSLEVQVLASSTSYPAELGLGGDKDGSAVHLSYRHDAQTWNAFARYQRFDPEFRADLGFVPRVDFETMEVGGRRILRREAGGWFTWLDFGFEASRTELVGGSLGGEVSDEAVAFVGKWQGPLQSYAEWRLAREKEYFAGTTYDQDTASLFYALQPSGSFSLNFSYDFGDAIDLENGRAADLARPGAGMNLRLGRHVELDLQYLLESLDVAGGRLYDAEITQGKLVYQWNVRTFLRAIVQSFQLTNDPALFLVPVEERLETLFTQLLFSYKINPQTVLFLGYSDGQLGIDQIARTRTDRTFFFKVGYAWSL